MVSPSRFPLRRAGLLLAWVWGPSVFLFSDLDFSLLSFVASLLVSILLAAALLGSRAAVRRDGALRGLLSSALVGALVGALLGVLQAGFWVDESWELSGLGAWVLAGMFLPPALWGFSQLVVFTLRLPSGVGRGLRRRFSSRRSEAPVPKVPVSRRTTPKGTRPRR